jgi:hypothetical protein
MTRRLVWVVLLGALATAATISARRAVDLDPKAVTYILPDKIPWKDSAAGTSASAPLYGDPSKPGPYAYFNKWKAGNMSRPHSHPNDRFILVVSGTWWMGTGAKFDPDATVPMPAGTWVVHYANTVHYDGAKQGDAILLIHGMGPATSTAAEQK